MLNFDERIKLLNDQLDNQFVDGYDKVKEWMSHINLIFKELNINFRYESYDEFCVDYKRNTLEFAKLKKDADLLDPKLVILWVPFVLRNIITTKYNEHGTIKQGLPLNQEEEKIREKLKDIIDSVKHKKEGDELENAMQEFGDELNSLDLTDKQKVDLFKRRIEDALRPKFGDIEVKDIKFVKKIEVEEEKPKKKRGRPPKNKD